MEQKLPHENSNKESDGNIHRPEFIVLEGDEGEESGPYQGIRSEYFETLQGLKRFQFPWTLRILMFFTMFFVWLGTIILAFFLLINILFSALTLFQSHAINATLAKSWKNVKKLSALSVGMFIAIFSPALGLGMIILYLMLEGEHLNKSIMQRFFKSKP